MVKEAIFNVLAARLESAAVLDLFAGSGALAIEALSRGAGRALLVERDERAAAVIRANLENLGYGKLARVVRAEVVRWLEANPEAVAGCSLILLDPTYNDPVLERALALLDRSCAAGTTVVAEHDPRHALPLLERLRTVRARRYGGTVVTVLES